MGGVAFELPRPRGAGTGRARGPGGAPEFRGGAQGWGPRSTLSSRRSKCVNQSSMPVDSIPGFGMCNRSRGQDLVF